MTTSLSNNENFYNKQLIASENYFEDFLESLEDINNYLDKKIIETNISDRHLINNKRTRRNLTQPIVFTNELNKLSKYDNFIKIIKIFSFITKKNYNLFKQN